MSRRPLAADLWEQALLNGRRIHASNDAAALNWAEQWYGAQGGVFDGPRAAPVPLEIADSSHLSDEAFAALMPQGLHATGDAEPEAKAEPEPEPEPEPEAALEPAKLNKPRRRARQEGGQLKGDDPTTPDVNEAWDGGDDAA